MKSSAPAFHPLDSRDQTQAVGLSSKDLYPVSHLVDLTVFVGWLAGLLVQCLISNW